MVGAVAFLPAAVVNDGGQIGKVSVQVEVLSVVTADLRRCVSLALFGVKRQTSKATFEIIYCNMISHLNQTGSDLSPVVVVAAVVALLGS